MMKNLVACIEMIERTMENAIEVQQLGTYDQSKNMFQISDIKRIVDYQTAWAWSSRYPQEKADIRI